MIKLMFRFIKKLIFAFIILYGVNVCVSSLNVIIPINVFTLGTVTFLGVPGMISLIALFFITR